MPTGDHQDGQDEPKLRRFALHAVHADGDHDGHHSHDQPATEGESDGMAANDLDLQGYGELLSMLRHRAHLSRDTVAQRAGIAEGTVSRYEANVPARPALSTVRDIMDVLADELELEPQDLWEQFEVWLLDRDRRRANRYLALQLQAIRGLPR